MLDFLKGVRVLDLSHVVAGPLASFYLAQLGAEVIKIERPAGGEVMRASRKADDGDTPAGFAALNAGKRSLAIDIRKPEGARIVRELARGAAVFIENFRPGVVAKYGLDAASIRAINPAIVYCSISGFGQEGQWTGRGAYDHIVQALTGMMMMNGTEQDPPVKVGFPVIDAATGMVAALAVIGALHARMADGRGRTIDASMAQASMMLMYTYSSAYLSSGERPTRVGNRGYSGSPAAETYRCVDGWLSVAANTPAQFRKLAAILGLEQLCSDGSLLDLDAFNAPNGGFVVARDFEGVSRRIREAFASRSASDMEAQLNAAGVAAARVRRLGEFVDAAEAGALRLPVATFAQGDRVVRTPGLGFRVLEEDDRAGAGAESLGASGRAILGELGLAPEEIERLAAAGVVRT